MGPLQIVNIVLGLAGLVCFVMIVVKMFQHGASTMGIVCLVLICCGGPLIALVYGWIKAGEWNMKGLMMIYTIILGINIVLGTIVQVQMSSELNKNLDRGAPIGAPR